MKAYNILAENVLFDRGGGGLQHADQLRKKGYAVKSVGFGEAATPDRKRGLTTMAQRKEQDEIKYVYKNRRAEMYGLLRDKLNPINTKGFGIPKRFKAFREQLAPIPFQFDGEGRIYLPPKYKKSKDSTETTLTELIGHSPDEVDALVLAVYGLERKIIKSRAGAY